MIAAFCVVSILIGIIALKKPSMFLVVITSSFFLYYCVLGLLNMRLAEGGSKYIHLFFLLVLFAYWTIFKRCKLTINSLDIFYLAYCFLWLAIYTANFDESLLTFKHYKQAPYFLCFTFILPIVTKPIYDSESIRDFLRQLEWIGYAAAVIIIICLVVGVSSKESASRYEIAELSDVYRYTPFRGFFSFRQAWLLSASIIIFATRSISSRLTKWEIAIKMPLVALCFLGTIISGTRGVFIFTGLLFCYLFIVHGDLKKKTVLILLSMIALGSLVQFRSIDEYRHLTSRILRLHSYTLKVGGVNTRVQAYERGLAHFAGQPVFGNGMSRVSKHYPYSHSSVISTLEDTGVVGFFLMFSLVLFVLHTCRWPHKDKSDSPEQIILRNLIVLSFLCSTLYGTIATRYVLFLLLHIYYFLYRQKRRGFPHHISDTKMGLLS